MRGRILGHFGQSQHRNAYYLMLNTVAGAATGLLFWWVLARVARLPPQDVGLGYALVALGTIIGVLAKGGFDSALVRTVPRAGHAQGARLLRLGVAVGGLLALLLSLGLALGSLLGGVFEAVTPLGWTLVAAIGVLLVVTWLQDAYFLAQGDARFSFHRNLVFSAARLVLPLAVVLLGAPQPVALSWALSLAVSALVAVAFIPRLAPSLGREVPAQEFFQTALRNVSGSAAEFLPGLLLAPIVLALLGPSAAAYFGIAWAAAAILFLGCAAISRSALAEMMRVGGDGIPAAVRRGALQHSLVVAPAALFVALLAPQLLSIFGPGYAEQGGLALTLLSCSVVVVAPSYFYLAILRAQERPWPLALFPAAMVAALAVATPWFASRFGLAGVAVAWFAANAPFGLFSLWKLRLMAREVIPAGPAATLGRVAHPE